MLLARRIHSAHILSTAAHTSLRTGTTHNRSLHALAHASSPLTPNAAIAAASCTRTTLRCGPSCSAVVSAHCCCLSTSAAAQPPAAASPAETASPSAASSTTTAAGAVAAPTSAPATPAAASPTGNATFDPATLHGLLRELYDRGMIADITHPEPLLRWLEGSASSPSDPSAGTRPSRVVYAGFDPTAPSLHIGNMLVLMVLRRFQAWGHKPVCVVGGATGMIGDPSGRSSERNMLSEEALQRNIAGIEKDIQKFLVFEEEGQQGGQALKADLSSASSTSISPASSSSSTVPPHCRSLLLNNAHWFTPLSLLPFLRDVGRHFRLGTMLAKDSVASRLGSASGMSFTEFCYQVLQAYDFLHLHRTRGVSIQVGGSDQWGNITAGVELIQREAAAAARATAAAEGTANGNAAPGAGTAANAAVAAAPGPQVFGLTLPLLTTSDGHKFGKSMGNAPIWLAAPPAEGGDASTSSGSTTSSPYELYQYFLSRTADADVGRFLRCFTDHSLEQIAAWEVEHASNPQALCKILAESVTQLVHGAAGLRAAQRSTAALFGGASFAELDALPLADFVRLFAGVPSVHLRRESQVVGQGVVSLAVAAGACKSKAEARRLIASGGLYVNNAKVTADSRVIEEADLLCQKRVCLLRSGKKKQFVVFCDDE